MCVDVGGRWFVVEVELELELELKVNWSELNKVAT